MFDILAALYPWTKAGHIISMTAWMAGLFYLPRLFVYHAETATAGSDTAETFKVMEKRLLGVIMRPAMISTWLFGILLLLTPGIISWSSDLWIYVKLIFVVLLTGFHEWLAKRQTEFMQDKNTRSGRTYRLVNEIPTLALVVIVVMVVVRPI